MKERGQEEARKIMRKKRGLLDTGEIGGLPDGFEGKVADLFSDWGAPTELTAAEKAQKEKDDKEKAEKEAREKEVRAVFFFYLWHPAACGVRRPVCSPCLPLHRSFCYANSHFGRRTALFLRHIAHVDTHTYLHIFLLVTRMHACMRARPNDALCSCSSSVMGEQ